MSYVAYFRDPAKPGMIQARLIARSFACKPEELSREIAIACGLARKCRERPERLLIEYFWFSNNESAQVTIDAHYSAQQRAYMNHANKKVIA